MFFGVVVIFQIFIKGFTSRLYQLLFLSLTAPPLLPLCHHPIPMRHETLDCTCEQWFFKDKEMRTILKKRKHLWRIKIADCRTVHIFGWILQEAKPREGARKVRQWVRDLPPGGKCFATSQASMAAGTQSWIMVEMWSANTHVETRSCAWASSTGLSAQVSRGGLPYKNDGGCSSYLLGVKICRLIPLRVQVSDTF